MAGRVFLFAAISFMSGIFIRSILDIHIEFILLLVIIGAAISLYWFLFQKRIGTAIFYIPLLLIVFSLGILRYDVSTWGIKGVMLDDVVGSVVILEGRVIKEPEQRENSVHITVHSTIIDGELIATNILVYAPRFADVLYGDYVRAKGQLRKPEVFDTDLGRTFNYPGYLSAKDIYYTMTFAEIERAGENEGNTFITALLTMKQMFMKNIEALLPEPQAGLAEGIVLGEKRALGSGLETAFRTTGIIHIVVLSGYNITIVAEAVMRLLSYFFAPKVRFVIGVVVIISFALLVGLSATVVRASLMALLVLAARFTGRTYEILRGLMFAALIMLIINPRLLVFDPGFQLSFLATLGLILLAPIIEERFKLVPTMFQVREFITATISTQIFVLPVLLYSIGELSLVAIPVNVLVLIVVPLAMLLVFLTGVLGFISVIIAFPVAYLAHLLLTYMILVVEFFAAFPLSSVMVPSFSIWWVFISYTALGVLMYIFQRNIKNKTKDKKKGRTLHVPV